MLIIFVNPFSLVPNCKSFCHQCVTSYINVQIEEVCVGTCRYMCVYIDIFKDKALYQLYSKLH